MTYQPAIQASQITKSFGSTPALDGVDLEVRPGTVLALLGPNGAGKSTLIRVLATLSRADSGTARVAGFDVVSQRSSVRRRISLTGQSAALDEVQSGRENLEMMGRLRGLGRQQSRERAATLLSQFDLSDAGSRRVATYSGGMRRRLDLAAGLVIPPTVMFLDEPTTGLDPRSRQQLWAVVAGLAETGVTVLLTTQYLEEADQLADEVAVIDHGQIVARGTAAELKHRVGGARLEVIAADVDDFDTLRSRLGDGPGVGPVQADQRTLTLSVGIEPAAASVRAVLDQLDPGRCLISRFAVQTATLDDVFAAVTEPSAAIR